MADRDNRRHESDATGDVGLHHAFGRNMRRLHRPYDVLSSKLSYFCFKVSLVKKGTVAQDGCVRSTENSLCCGSNSL